jgi:5-methylcytosine-specific restriction endonuclease McrBC regulatory subunit McrC
MRTTDNNGGNFTVNSDEHCEILKTIGNRSVKDLCKSNKKLLVFPHSFDAGYYGEDQIFSVDNDARLTTKNIMGFIGKNNTQLTVCSRFAQDEKDYFLHYMLQKVFIINIFNFDQTFDKENIWDFLLYLFPYFLKEAYNKQGMYKAYRREQYNDANVKGTIDMARHIRINIPFTGEIAYNTREHDYDNSVTQLIRHTIEHIKLHSFGRSVLNCDSDTRDIVSKICFITQNRYDKNKRQQVINANLKPVSHPYFTKYKILQHICLEILRREKITFGPEKDKIYGLLFDGAWLWEEYLNTFLKINFLHADNKKKINGYCLFENFQEIYPDFVSKDPKKMIVGDAKYIPLDKQREYENSEKATSIYYKTITYMYRLKSDNGFLIFPSSEKIDKVYQIKDTKGKLRKISLPIPQNSENFSEFRETMKTMENEIINKLSDNPQ